MSDFLINFCNVSHKLQLFLFDWKAAVCFVRVENGSYASCFLLGFFAEFMGEGYGCVHAFWINHSFLIHRGMLEMFFPWFEVMLLGFCICFQKTCIGLRVRLELDSNICLFLSGTFNHFYAFKQSYYWIPVSQAVAPHKFLLSPPHHSQG